MSQDYAYAAKLLDRGLSYAAVNQATRIPEASLRAFLRRPVKREPEAVEVRTAPVRRPAAVQRFATARVNGRDVIAYVASRHDLTLKTMESQRRTRCVARPRQIAMYALRELCPHLSLPAIGRLLGGRDHTTILHGVRHISALMLHDPDVSEAVCETIGHFRALQAQAAAPETMLVDGAMAFRALCEGYGQAMKAAA